MTTNSSVLAIRVSPQTVRIQLQPMPQSALINSPPSRFSGTTLTSDNTLSLKLGEGDLPVPTNTLARDFKKFQSEGGQGNDGLMGYVLKGRRAHQNKIHCRAER